RLALAGLLGYARAHGEAAHVALAVEALRGELRRLDLHGVVGAHRDAHRAREAALRVQLAVADARALDGARVVRQHVGRQHDAKLLHAAGAALLVDGLGRAHRLLGGGDGVEARLHGEAERVVDGEDLRAGEMAALREEAPQRRDALRVGVDQARAVPAVEHVERPAHADARHRRATS